MHPVLQSLVDRHGGLVTRNAALQVVAPWTLERAYRAGHLRRVLPRVYVDARLLEQKPTPEQKSTPERSPSPRPPLAHLSQDLAIQAALAYADGRAALSHLTALRSWGLHQQPSSQPIHLSAPVHSTIRNRPYLLIHRRPDFIVEAPDVVHRKGLPLTALEPTLVDSWPLLPPTERPGPVIRAVNNRLTTPHRIAEALATAPRLTGRAELRMLLDRLAAGCRSPLEIWGHDHVFTGPGMPPFLRQFRIEAGGRVMYLDMYAERQRLNIELDGATTHGDPRQREIDLRRDALLATLGILVVRFSHRRLTHEPDEVRRETLAILANR
ncbi:endonuclease domain-containing protein [Micromonospora zhanjiangensis]|uniref:Endonuclease domain-containing protein n=1 Tax=Micromonospora zhanjiangensis TaxID=1522057 RepID=A0ABV8KIV0_9ACTN